jgi:hypothetical protein
MIELYLDLLLCEPLGDSPELATLDLFPGLHVGFISASLRLADRVDHSLATSFRNLGSIPEKTLIGHAPRIVL